MLFESHLQCYALVITKILQNLSLNAILDQKLNKHYLSLGFKVLD